MLHRLRAVSASWVRRAMRGQEWIWPDVVAPLVITRLGLVVVGWLAQIFAVDPRYPLSTVPRSSVFVLDMWCRWDCSWYFRIINRGYQLQGSIQNQQASLAFYPLYPYLVKLLASLVPFSQRTPPVVLLTGLIVSNLFLLLALACLYKLTLQMGFPREAAQRVVLYLLFFPTSFYFSAFYTESIFLFFSAAAFYAAARQKWLAAGILGFFAALSRPVGIVLFLPLGLLYLQSIQYKPKLAKPEMAWLLLIPAGLAVYLVNIYPLTHDLLAPYKAQSAWGKITALPWQTFFGPVWYDEYIKVIQQGAALAVIALIAAAWFLLPSKVYSLYSLLLVAPPLLSGTLASFTRYAMVAFPVFIVLAAWGKHKNVDLAVKVLFLLLQGLLMAAWVRYYPIY